MIGQPIKDLRRRQTVAFELALEVLETNCLDSIRVAMIDALRFEHQVWLFDLPHMTSLKIE